MMFIDPLKLVANVIMIIYKFIRNADTQRKYHLKKLSFSISISLKSKEIYISNATRFAIVCLYVGMNLDIMGARMMRRSKFMFTSG